MTNALRLQFLVCPQRDFIGTRAELEPSIRKEHRVEPQPEPAYAGPTATYPGSAAAALPASATTSAAAVAAAEAEPEAESADAFWRLVAEKRKLHVGPAAVHKLRGDDPRHDPFVTSVKRLYENEIPGLGDNVRVVIDEDWHPRACAEFPIFGVHCVKGSDGAMLVGELQEYRWHDKTHQLRANSINPAANPAEYRRLLEDALGGEKPEYVKAGIMGVWTHIKVELLAVVLNTMWPFLSPSQIGICGPLCASPNEADHEMGLRKMTTLGYQTFDELDAYLQWFAADV